MTILEQTTVASFRDEGINQNAIRLLISGTLTPVEKGVYYNESTDKWEWDEDKWEKNIVNEDGELETWTPTQFESLVSGSIREILISTASLSEQGLQTLEALKLSDRIRMFLQIGEESPEKLDLKVSHKRIIPGGIAFEVNQKLKNPVPGNIDVFFKYKENTLHGNYRIPDAEEWKYLIDERPNPFRFAKAMVNDIPGLLIFPDDWEIQDGIIDPDSYNSANSPYYVNLFSGEDWKLLETAGAIFLPATGYRNGTVYVDSLTGYWSSDGLWDGSVTTLNFNSNLVSPLGTFLNYIGCPVRLLQESDFNGRFSISEDQKVSFARGNLQYKPASGEWKVAENPWDMAGRLNENISEDYDGWIDLFGFGTSGWDSGFSSYQPWSVSTSESDYINRDLTGDYVNADWGIYNKDTIHVGLDYDGYLCYPSGSTQIRVSLFPYKFPVNHLDYNPLLNNVMDIRPSTYAKVVRNQRYQNFWANEVNWTYNGEGAEIIDSDEDIVLDGGDADDLLDHDHNYTEFGGFAQNGYLYPAFYLEMGIDPASIPDSFFTALGFISSRFLGRKNSLYSIYTKTKQELSNYNFKSCKESIETSVRRRQAIVAENVPMILSASLTDAAFNLRNVTASLIGQLEVGTRISGSVIGGVSCCSISGSVGGMILGNNPETRPYVVLGHPTEDDEGFENGFYSSSVTATSHSFVSPLGQFEGIFEGAGAIGSNVSEAFSSIVRGSGSIQSGRYLIESEDSAIDYSVRIDAMEAKKSHFKVYPVDGERSSAFTVIGSSNTEPVVEVVEDDHVIINPIPRPTDTYRLFTISPRFDNNSRIVNYEIVADSSEIYDAVLDRGRDIDNGDSVNESVESDYDRTPVLLRNIASASINLLKVSGSLIVTAFNNAAVTEYDPEDPTAIQQGTVTQTYISGTICPGVSNYTVSQFSGSAVFSNSDVVKNVTLNVQDESVGVSNLNTTNKGRLKTGRVDGPLVTLSDPVRLYVADRQKVGVSVANLDFDSGYLNCNVEFPSYTGLLAADVLAGSEDFVIGLSGSDGLIATRSEDPWTNVVGSNWWDNWHVSWSFNDAIRLFDGSRQTGSAGLFVGGLGQTFTLRGVKDHINPVYPVGSQPTLEPNPSVGGSGEEAIVERTDPDVIMLSTLRQGLANARTFAQNELYQRSVSSGSELAITPRRVQLPESARLSIVQGQNYEGTSEYLDNDLIRTVTAGGFDFSRANEEDITDLVADIDDAIEAVERDPRWRDVGEVFNGDAEFTGPDLKKRSTYVYIKIDTQTDSVNINNLFKVNLQDFEGVCEYWNIARDDDGNVTRQTRCFVTGSWDSPGRFILTNSCSAIWGRFGRGTISRVGNNLQVSREGTGIQRWVSNTTAVILGPFAFEGQMNVLKGFKAAGIDGEISGSGINGTISGDALVSSEMVGSISITGNVAETLEATNVKGGILEGNIVDLVLDNESRDLNNTILFEGNLLGNVKFPLEGHAEVTYGSKIMLPKLCNYLVGGTILPLELNSANTRTEAEVYAVSEMKHSAMIVGLAANDEMVINTFEGGDLKEAITVADEEEANITRILNILSGSEFTLSGSLDSDEQFLLRYGRVCIKQNEDTTVPLYVSSLEGTPFTGRIEAFISQSVSGTIDVRLTDPGAWDIDMEGVLQNMRGYAVLTGVADGDLNRVGNVVDNYKSPIPFYTQTSFNGSYLPGSVIKGRVTGIGASKVLGLQGNTNNVFDETKYGGLISKKEKVNFPSEDMGLTFMPGIVYIDDVRVEMETGENNHYEPVLVLKKCEHTRRVGQYPGVGDVIFTGIGRVLPNSYIYSRDNNTIYKTNGKGTVVSKQIVNYDDGFRLIDILAL